LSWFGPKLRVLNRLNHLKSFGSKPIKPLNSSIFFAILNISKIIYSKNIKFCSGIGAVLLQYALQFGFSIFVYWAMERGFNILKIYRLIKILSELSWLHLRSIEGQNGQRTYQS
jgi:hypothetical protein